MVKAFLESAKRGKERVARVDLVDSWRPIRLVLKVYCRTDKQDERCKIF